MIWTDERIEALKAMWAEGRSASEIAAALGGVTRNAVIGKVHRFKLPGRPKRPPKPRATIAIGKRPSSRGRANHGGTVAKIAAGPPRFKPVPKPKPVRVEDVPEPVSRGLTVMDLSDRTCKWPTNDPPHGGPYLFCGAATEPGGPYCRHHFLRSRDRAARREEAA